MDDVNTDVNLAARVALTVAVVTVKALMVPFGLSFTNHEEFIHLFPIGPQVVINAAANTDADSQLLQKW